MTFLEKVETFLGTLGKPGRLAKRRAPNRKVVLEKFKKAMPHLALAKLNQVLGRLKLLLVICYI